METLALMLAAVGLSLLVGVPLGIVAGRSDRFQAAISPVLDAMQIIPAFAYLMPVVILFSIGPAAAVVSTMVYAVPPAVRITALGIRGVRDELRRGRRLDGRDAEADARQGAAAARPPDAAPRRQPDDPVRPLDGRDRRPDRRRRARSGRHERAVHEPRARDPRRDRDRDHGDGPRPLDGGRSPSRTDPAKRHLDDAARSRLRRFSRRSSCSSARRSSRPASSSASRRSIRTRRRAAGRRRSRPGCSTQIQSVLDYVQDPTSWVFQITEPIGNFLLTKALLPLQELPGRDAVVRHPRRADADRVPDQRPPAGDHDVPDARLDRGHGGLGARDGHALAGARGHRARRRDRGRARRLGGREHRGVEDAAARSTTCCRRCRSSSTSSRSSI